MRDGLRQNPRLHGRGFCSSRPGAGGSCTCTGWGYTLLGVKVADAIYAGMRADRARDIEAARWGRWGSEYNGLMGAWAMWGWSLNGRGGLGYPGIQLDGAKVARMCDNGGVAALDDYPAVVDFISGISHLPSPERHEATTDAQFQADCALTELDLLRDELAALKARRCDGCAYWRGRNVELGRCVYDPNGPKSFLVEDMYVRPHHHCAAWVAREG